MQFLMFEYYVYSEQVPKPFRSRKILTGSYCSIVFIFLPPRAHGATMKSSYVAQVQCLGFVATLTE